ncbi:DUF4350 domain-containing protein [Streptomyces sp. NRRL S-87]|uniref:DUF4350 domain-containing protein n=1 Tax=Streptomyces sp. NRRL S-87 TaxID=1463920 RepID=UPI0004BE8EE2|nr:DUF4350 domain-containing protein [Streptomyces sp. NRRL S-87]
MSAPPPAAPATRTHDGAPPATDAPAPGPAATSASPTPTALWRRFRGPLLAAAVLLAAGLVLAALTSGGDHGRLDPRSPDPQGTRALAELLADHGVTTRTVATTDEAVAAAAPGTTLVVANPGLLTGGQQAALKTAMDLSGGRTVLLAPGPAAVAALTPGVRAAPATTTDTDPAPDCPLPAAVSAGRARTGGGWTYRTPLPTATGCYPQDGRPTLLTLPGRAVPGTPTDHTPHPDTVLLGSPAALLNEHLDEQGNASLALQLLGTRPHVTWYLPTLADPSAAAADERRGFGDLIPAGWSWALLQLFVAAALAAAWRAHRLGPLVTERLPVAVRASEATEGRARLYRKTNARDRAAAVLRAASRERLAALLGVPPAAAHDPASLLPALATRLNRTPGAPGPAGPAQGSPAADDLTAHPPTLLFGPPPTTDAALVALTDHLDALEREVRSS